MSIVDTIFSHHTTRTAIVRWPLSVIVNGVTTKPVPPARYKVADAIYWAGSMSQRFISQQFIADVAGVVLFNPDDVTKQNVPDNSRIDITDEAIGGAVNLLAGYSTGATTMLVDGFSDALKPIKLYDTFFITGETGSIEHEVVSTIKTAGATTSITFKPALASNVLDNAEIIVTPILERVIAIKCDDIALQGQAIIVPVKVYT